jgi:hypothetical protein
VSILYDPDVSCFLGKFLKPGVFYYAETDVFYLCGDKTRTGFDFTRPTVKRYGALDAGAWTVATAQHSLTQPGGLAPMPSFSECNSRSAFSSRDRANNGGGSRKRLLLTFLLVWSGSALAQRPIILSSATLVAKRRSQSTRKLIFRPNRISLQSSSKKESRCDRMSEQLQCWCAFSP